MTEFNPFQAPPGTEADDLTNALWLAVANDGPTDDETDAVALNSVALEDCLRRAVGTHPNPQGDHS